MPVLSRALRADLLLPFFVLVGFEVEDFDEDDEENDDADPDDDAVSHADLFGDVGMLQTLICKRSEITIAFNLIRKILNSNEYLKMGWESLYSSFRESTRNDLLQINDTLFQFWFSFITSNNQE